MAEPMFGWRDEYLLGDDVMDGMHREFVDCVNALMSVDDNDLGRALEQFADHARRHFGQEDRCMREIGYEAAGCHIDEHAAVLKSLEEVRHELQQGRPDVVRAFARALAEWFPEHARVMDSGLASSMVKRRLGGVPLTLRPRNATV